MTKWRDLNYGQAVPEAFFDAIMEELGTYMSSNFRVTQIAATTLRVPASSGNGQVAVAISGKWRYNTANADATAPAGGAATYTLWVTGTDNSFTAGPPEVDNTVYSFGLEIRASGSPSAAISRQIGTVEWDGTRIVQVRYDNDAGHDPWLPGMMMPWGGSAAPTNWLLCNGAAVSRTTYFRLFGAIGTAFGVGDGSTTFNVPNTMGRTIIGAGSGSGLTARTVGQSGGTETDTISIAQMPAHDHGGATGAATPTGTVNATTDTGVTAAAQDTATTSSTGSHTHSMDGVALDLSGGLLSSGIVMARGGSGVSASRFGYDATAGGAVVTSGYLGAPFLGAFSNAPAAAGTHAHTLTTAGHAHTLVMNAHSHTFTGNSQTHTISSQGSGSAHNTMQPWVAASYIIRAL